MMFFMMAATVAPAKIPTKPVTQTQKKEAMGTVFELNGDVRTDDTISNASGIHMTPVYFFWDKFAKKGGSR